MTITTHHVGETWRFEVTDSHAERVYLVREAQDGGSCWITMQAQTGGRWSTTAELGPGRYRFRYFTAEGEAYYNGGTFGLRGQRVDAADPLVSVEPFSADPL